MVDGGCMLSQIRRGSAFVDAASDAFLNNRLLMPAGAVDAVMGYSPERTFMHQDEPKSFAAGPRSQAPSSRNTPTTRPPPDDDSGSQSGAISDRSLKQLNENITTLVGFLHKNVGRPWNKVYGEICGLMSVESPIQKLVLDRLKDLVATTVVVIDGKPHRRAAGGADRSQFQPLKGTKWDSLYVCPSTGVLRSVERMKEPLRKADPDVRTAGPLSQYRRVNGVWYLIELAFIPSLQSALSSHYDVLLHAPVADISSETIRKMYGSYDRYAVAKRPLTKRELQRLIDENGGEI
jgi:hypothetical protein